MPFGYGRNYERSGKYSHEEGNREDYRGCGKRLYRHSHFCRYNDLSNKKEFLEERKRHLEEELKLVSEELSK